MINIKDKLRDDQKFTQIINQHSQQIYNIALHMVHDEMVADDLTQEVFLKIYYGLSGFRGDAKLSTWIYRIVKNTCYNHLKKEKKLKIVTEITRDFPD